MMGTTHFASAGLAGALAVNLATPHASLPCKLFFTAVCAGAGTANDIDQPGSRVARSYGFATGLLTVVVHRVSGGHREATHELPGEAITAGTAALCAALIGDRAAQWVLGCLLAILLATVLEILRFRHVTAGLLAAGIAVAVIVLRFDLGAVAWAILLGMAVHVAGDSCTKHGTCPFKPLWDKRVRLPRRMRVTTGSKVERRLIAPVLIAGLLASLAWTSGAGPVLMHVYPSARTALARR